MIHFTLKRIASSLPTLLLISVICFGVIQLPPGDFASKFKDDLVQLGGISDNEAEKLANDLREEYGLNKPILIQYCYWIKGILLNGDFGYSFSYKKDVGSLIAERMPPTFLLAMAAHFISSILGILLGIFSATRQYSWIDTACSIIAFMGTSIPRFFLALILMYLLMFKLGVRDVGGFYSAEYSLSNWSLGKLWDLFMHVWPVVVIAGFGGLARNMRVMRANLLDVLNAPYVNTARAKGLKERKVIQNHAVPNALHTIIMYQGMVLPYMLIGEMEAAIVMGIPTMGPMFFQSLLSQDIYLSGSFLLILSGMLVLGNMLADILLAVLDPRIRYN